VRCVGLSTKDRVANDLGSRTSHRREIGLSCQATHLPAVWEASGKRDFKATRQRDKHRTKSTLWDGRMEGYFIAIQKSADN